MSHTKFTKQGLIEIDWNSDNQAYEESPCEKPMLCLRSRCEIEDGVTLLDIFEYVDRNKPLMEFISLYSWCRDIEAFHRQARLPQSKEDPKEKLEYIEISAWADANRKEAFTLYTHLCAIGVYDGESGMGYSISASPMNDIACLPVKLKPKIEFLRNFKKKLALDYSYSLLEVLDCIYWDISFYGGPKEKVEFLDGLHECSEEIKAMERGEIPSTMIELDLSKIDEDS